MDTPPSYPYPLHRLVLPALRVLLGIPSTPSKDAGMLLAGVYPQPIILNVSNIPKKNPFILVMNHYDRPGLGAWWGTIAIMSALAARRRDGERELHFVVAREWWYPGGIGRAFKQPLTRWFFGQLAKSYGLVLVPPIIADDRFRGEGTIAVRRALRLTAGAHPLLIGIAPEGRTGPNQTLCEPPNGAGLFAYMLTHGMIPCLAAGVFEQDRTLTVGFGSVFHLDAPSELSRDARDRAAARRLMVEIGKTLPERMWGVYSEDIRRSREEDARKLVLH